MSKMFDEWLLSTRVLQRQSFGKDPATLMGAALADYLRWNALALVKETGEALDEFDWKPWTVTEAGFYDRDKFVEEMVDVLHFAANMLVAARCTDDELTEIYRTKQQKNRDRMASGTYAGNRPEVHVALLQEPEPLDDGWEDIELGTNLYVGDTVRVKVDAFTTDRLATLHNGREGRLVAVDSGRCVVMYDDRHEFRFLPAQLQVQKIDG